MRMPVIAISEYRIRVTPPSTPEGIDLTIALNFAKNPNNMANVAAKSITSGENTLVTDYEIHFLDIFICCLI
jgi:hypothetical protein